MKVIGFANQKGGVGKTLLSTNVACCLARKHKVLFLDLDQQGNASKFFLEETPKHSLIDLFREPMLPIEKIITPSKFKNLDVGPATLDLAQAEFIIASQMDRSFALKNEIQRVESKYQFVIVDFPPSITAITRAGLILTHELIIPLYPDQESVTGSKNMEALVKTFQGTMNPQLKIKGWVLNRIKSTSIHSIMIKQIEALYKERLLPVRIKDVTLFQECRIASEPIFSVAKKSEHAKAIEKIAETLLK